MWWPATLTTTTFSRQDWWGAGEGLSLLLMFAFGAKKQFKKWTSTSGQSLPFM